MSILIKKPVSVKILNYLPRAVIMGRTGAGKTTLLNKVCGTNHKAGAGNSSFTRNLFLSSNAAGNHSFELIDTPGTKSFSEPLKHAILLREGLTCTDLNTIFIVLKYENRFDTLLNNYLEEQKIVDKFDKKIILIISHADCSDDPARDFESIKQIFEDWCENIIFYSEKYNNEKMADLMYACMSQMNKEKLEITDEEFHLKFETSSIPLKRQMIEASRKYEENIRKNDKDYKNFCLEATDSISDNYEITELLQAVLVEYKNELEKCLQTFQNEFDAYMAELDQYCLWIKLQKKTVEMCDQFQDFIMQLMNLDLRDPHDPRNVYKRCPYCRLVWVKVFGCDNVQCGNRLELKKDITKMPFRKFVIERKDGKLSYVKNVYEAVKENVLENFSAILTIFKNLSFQPEKKIATVQSLGCGREFNWKSGAICLKEEEVFEIFSVKTLDKAKELMKGERFAELNNEMLNQIDKTFH